MMFVRGIKSREREMRLSQVLCGLVRDKLGWFTQIEPRFLVRKTYLGSVAVLKGRYDKPLLM